MDRKQAENYVFAAIAIITILVFIITPAYPSGGIGYRIDDFFNQYLFGNGYYKPSNYPFAAKVTNSISVVLAVVTGFFMGIWRRNDVIVSLMPKNFWLWILVVLGLVIIAVLVSIYPQEFSVSKGRLRMTETFHNNPVSFMVVMLAKTICIYAPVRFLVSLTFYLLIRKDKSNRAI
ncbi:MULTISPECIES: hypothetical protein [unclassified Neisseria]|uniref:hypothetical protein n=1 Tax=unclassified Neisseria TaxID=2623750 RepID=UPI0010729D4D|nr:MULTISPECIES: hypothetical protein [unclassified Neisseria]MBF0804974.1 hypothetical protein [Neisseria sp. 19428wB4_WF04]TFU39305.1 hypothetical protein E4T99_11790 [Neisseria sp. WF04]